MLWIKNTEGKPSASLTMAFVAFILVSAWLVTWVVAALFKVEVPAFDVASAMGYLSPLLMLYFGRRFTDTKGTKTGSEDTSPDE